MKPLNRPMFKYGGPIKEGIMHGMRESKKDGNIVGGKQSPLLAGAHPLKDAEGREQHFIPALYAAGLGALRAAPLVYRGFKAARTFTPGNLGFMGRAKDLLLGSGRFRDTTKFVKDADRLLPKKPGGPQFTPVKTEKTKLGLFESLKDPTRLGAAIREYPFLALSTPSLATSAVTGGGPIAIDAAKGVANFLVPGTRFDPFKDDKAEVPTKEGGGLKRGDKSKNVGDTSVTGTTKPGEAGGTTVKSDAEKQQINEARIQETKDKYYKLMGLDKMKKDAVYDSLIDASKIVSEEGADLKGSIRSGNLQNRIIQAISGQLDKSAALKRQIDAAVLKGEIEKDIKANDPAAKLAAQLTGKQIELADKKLKGDSAAEILANAEIAGKNLVTSNTLTSILASKGTSVDFTFPDDKYQKWEKNNKTKDEIDYLTENYGSLDDGLYVVNKKAVQVKDGSATFVDLDEITG